MVVTATFFVGGLSWRLGFSPAGLVTLGTHDGMHHRIHRIMGEIESG